MQCTLCGKFDEEAIHLPLYVMGSEGIIVCKSCQINLTKFARALMETSTRVKMQTLKDAKKA